VTRPRGLSIPHCVSARRCCERAGCAAVRMSLTAAHEVMGQHLVVDAAFMPQSQDRAALHVQAQHQDDWVRHLYSARESFAIASRRAHDPPRAPRAIRKWSHGSHARWLDDGECRTRASASRRSMRRPESPDRHLLPFPHNFLFYFLRDRRLALASALDLLPLSAAELTQVTSRVVDTIYATFYGTLVCAAVQGALGGVMFLWLGLPAPLFWGVIMALLAIVPVFGAFVIWIPAAAFLALDGHWVQALILTAWGSIVIAGIDNVLYPILVGNRLRLHTVPAFVAVVGGLVVFGTSGVVVGPLVVTVTLALLEIWRARTQARSAQDTVE
jgi:AI-2E family transporter